MLELAELIWRKINGGEEPFRYVSDPPFEHDVQRRVPDVDKASDVLGFEATTPLDEMLDEVIPWIRDQLDAGRISPHVAPRTPPGVRGPLIDRQPSAKHAPDPRSSQVA